MKIHEVITEQTWCRGAGGSISNMLTPTCAIGWCHRVYGNENLEGIAQNKLKAVLGIESGIVEWNDSPSTTFPEVLAAFKAADL